MINILIAVCALSLLSLPILFIILLVSLICKKYRKRSAFALLAAFIIMLSSTIALVALSPEEDNVVQKEDGYTEGVIAEEETAPSTEGVFNQNPKETIIYSNHGIVVTYKGIKGLRSFDYEIVNNSDSDYFYHIGGFAVNNCMVPDFMARSPITAGNKAVEKYDISATKDYGIKEVETVDIYFVFQNDDYEIIDDVICHIDLSSSNTFVYDTERSAFYDDDHISAYLEVNGNKYKDINAVYYNKTNNVITAMLTEVSINGVMLSGDTMAYYDILPGCYAYTGASDGTLTLWDAIESEIKEKTLSLSSV